MTSQPRRDTPRRHDNTALSLEPVPAGRGTVLAAAGLAVFILVMFVVGSPWSFLAGVAVTVAAHDYDRKVRPGQAETPLIAYVLGIYLLGVVTIVVAATVLLGVVASLP